MDRPPKDAFQIGWICALPIEAAAAHEMLDVKFGILDEQDPADSNTYMLGRTGKHNVVIAALGGEYGTTSATVVANNMLRTFSNSLRIGLMVGVGGGIPSAAHDIRLGDVVVSYPDATCGGVIHYDRGKIIAGGEFQRTGSLNSPPRALLTAVNTMRAASLTDDPSYLGYIQSAIERNARTRKNFGRPPSQSDRLFRAEYDHPLNESSCSKCPTEWEQMRDPRDDKDPLPHYGVIASDNKVIKHGETREQLRLRTSALCFEMEAAGLMLDFPCIVIRGICDYADSHKNKAWQGYAALVAAAYTKELLEYLPVGQVSQEGLAVDMCNGLAELKGIRQDLDQARNQEAEHHREKLAFVLTEQHNRCHQTFKTSPYEEQKNINPIKAEGTCQWALQSIEYTRWLGSNSNDLLWVSADPGCGKSVLSRSLVEDFLKDSTSDVTVCYFFFKDNDEQDQLDKALCSVLHQLFSNQPQLLRHALPSWKKTGSKLQGEVEELWRIFMNAALSDNSCKTICIFDALDECREMDQKRLIEKLQRFHHLPCPPTQESWLKFLVTSRPYAEIIDGFQDVMDSCPILHLKGEDENDQISQEIDIVVRLRVHELAKGKDLPLDIVQRIEQQLLQMRSRTYLWLHLAMADIRDTFKNSLRPTEEEIQLIPRSVNEAYEKILSRVPSNRVGTVKNILQIIVGARRPLTTAEMAMALGIAESPQSETAAEAGLDSSRIGGIIRRLCGLFVFINHSKVYLLHQTAKDFLMRKNNACNIDHLSSWTLTEVEHQLALICLRCLLMNDLVDDEFYQLRGFLKYAAIYWPDHVRDMGVTQDPEAIQRLQQIYTMAPSRLRSWFAFILDMEGEDPSVEEVPDVPALNVASFNGHIQAVEFLLSATGTDINAKDWWKNDSVLWASRNGHYEVVQLLLERGADINAQVGFYGSALQAASQEGHDRIVQLLLERGADINAQVGFYGSALQAASQEGHDRIVQLLLERGADINAQGSYYINALQAASYNGHDRIVQLLLERGADVNAQGIYYGIPLQVASQGGHDRIVQLLLERGADVNAQGGYYGNALQAASTRGHDRIVQLLLERGADVNAQCGHYGSALQAACTRGHDRIVQLLLERGADINAQGGHYGSALQAASYNGHDRIVQLLLERGADTNAQASYYGSALQAASQEGHDRIVQLLLERGADTNAQGSYYGSALQAASQEGHDRVVQLLLERGADVNAQGSYYGSALQVASQEGHDRVVQLLLERGADVNAQGGFYGSALQAASTRGHDRIVHLLLERGAEISAQGGF
ncbi:ANK_REP_REGION domain-containing protein [Penicillium ucsense]|uniref:ANK_REP_REGION domain-containing protein n=1 Tax=Penicillium ucsense TaxID=2839758 RepID=A0A8J8W3X3_9EURO|nr:ANK_REP_REGION domain-containing protein [Penicillium ucsense]KAF7736546.1 ANK_REP_REGION domain-containing protein [Penicillium ucsense]